MNVLSNSNFIYGLYLTPHPYANSTKRIDNRHKITYYEVYMPWSGFCYTNGASIYKTNFLKIYDYNYPFLHIGLRSTKDGKCNISLY